ncbi:kinesin-like protein KIN-7N isoform X2 [Rhododendron vialii]|uniref:kinesin-like protein KIN-7N isoform X2 n=1 Tax=Rhododendron vialii TaxID=182163 RepID=UPI00265F0E72|nr:kinesin-like protein KIN-7N isoform X2 [Rhododendron vialii]
MEKICVAVRVRPPVSEETSNGTFWKIEDNRRISLHRSLSTPISGASYAFDYVFDQDCRNETVYELLTKEIIHAAVEGFNGTAFAYGQTSSGKTFTMNGSESDPGIIHRAVKDIFTKIQMTNDREFLIRVSYMEIYNEEINDLFAVENQKLQIHESLERGIFVAGLREEIVNSAEQVLKLIQSGEVNRHFGETNMNVRSSRSHTIFRMVIESKGKDTSLGDYSSSDDAIRVSVLNLVDLAGSERIAKTGAGGVRLKEGKHINKSLMILGNVINKLSEGAKQRGHIPYRDSKLTRILQPALGGNAKTSIICTVAPEEVHIEETKGTLQFASRAKRITNCVQVNEILTDAALLKRQKLEIEELRSKLQGSRAEVLEQEILKLRNDMLKYELEHEKLAMELEEERKSHKERDQCIKEQQMKLDNFSSLVTLSDSDRKSSQGQEFSKQSLKDDGSDGHSIFKEDAFSTPCFKAVPNAFVMKRSNYCQQPEYSPLPDTFSNVADEDTWLKMNKGYKVDLDSLHMTPARKVQSFPDGDITPGCSIGNYKQEIQNLKRLLEIERNEKDELKRNHAEQKLLNECLMGEISEIQQEAQLVQEIPRQLLESVANCKDMYSDVLWTLQSFVTDEKSSASKLLSSTSEIGTSLFSTLETHFSMAIESQRTSTGNNILVEEQSKMLCERVNSTIKSLVLSESPKNEDKLSRSLLCNWDYKDCTLGEEIACKQEKLSKDLSKITEKYRSLEKELNVNTHLLALSKERYHTLEREFHLLNEERDTLLQTVSSSSKSLAQVSEEKDRIWQDLNSEVQRRKHLEEEMKQFGIAFARRQKSLVSLQSEFKSKFEKLKSQNPISIPKSLGY